MQLLFITIRKLLGRFCLFALNKTNEETILVEEVLAARGDYELTDTILS